MNYRIISESAANIYKIKDIPYTCVCASIDTATTRYVDNQGLDVELMMDQLYSYYGEANITIPSIEDWYQSFKGEDYTFVLPNTTLLSESFNNAVKAKEKYNSLFPDKKIFVLNSNATGPALGLIIEKLVKIIEEENEIDTILNKIQAYMDCIHFVVSCKKPSSIVKKVFANTFLANFGFHTIATLKSKKVCFKNKMYDSLINTIKESGFNGNKLVIAHNNTRENIEILIKKLKETFGSIQIEIIENSGINAYYYGKDAILVGYEK